MGCDIHMTIEVRDGDKWRRVDKCPPRPCWCDGKIADHWKCGGTGIDESPYHDRNYAVFAALANVRNDGNIKPISEPRGLPDDCTHGVGEEDDFEHGDHSFTWLLLSEVLAYPWNAEIQDEGFVPAAAFDEWDKAGRKGPPKTWSAGVGGGSVRHVTNAEMRRRIDQPCPWQAMESPYTLIRWSVPLSQYARHFLAFAESLRAVGDPASVRLVFGFDS